MNNVLTQLSLHVGEDQILKRSRWFGPNLLTFLTTSEETSGAFSLIKNVMQKGFETPLHVHTREDESHVLLDGEIHYQIGDQTICAKQGDYVYMPKGVPHNFTLISHTAIILLLITPGGFEEMFMRFSRPALSMNLPTLSSEKPGKEFFEKMKIVNEELGVTMLPAL